MAENMPRKEDKMKYPLQKELEKDLQESIEQLDDAMKSSDGKRIGIARCYYNAIKRINDICVNRNRF